MRAKDIRKLRVKIANFNLYEVCETRKYCGLFDNPKNSRLILACDFEHALKRFLKFYHRKYKKIHYIEIVGYSECSESSGKIMVRNRRTKFERFYF